MFDMFFIAGIFLYILLCAFEFVVFNEEILLTVCFLSFVFFSFNTMSDTVLDIFNSRGAKFEADLLVSFQLATQSLSVDFDNFFKFRCFFSKFKILLSSILFYLANFKNYSFIEISATIYNIGIDKISSFFLLQNEIFGNFQNTCIFKLLYPLIYETIDITAFPQNNNEIQVNFSSDELKSLSY
jgi:hypothetical protein